jgi:UDP-N-acetyl-D-mannosaminuronate dehydrogenase
MLKFNSKRKAIIEEEIKNLKVKKFNKILIIGLSYKKNSFSIVNSPLLKLLKKKNIWIYDDYYNLSKIKNFKIINNFNCIKNFNLLIYNYSNQKTVETIKQYLKKNKKSYLINISMSNFNLFNEKNVKNIFFSQTNNII